VKVLLFTHGKFKMNLVEFVENHLQFLQVVIMTMVIMIMKIMMKKKKQKK
jgi:hypothetical protein